MKGVIILSIWAYEILKEKGLQLTKEEGELLQTRWEAIKSLKKDFDLLNNNTADIHLVQLAKREEF